MSKTGATTTSRQYQKRKNPADSQKRRNISELWPESVSFPPRETVLFTFIIALTKYPLSVYFLKWQKFLRCVTISIEGFTLHPSELLKTFKEGMNRGNKNVLSAKESMSGKLSTRRKEGHYLLSSKLNEELKFNALERICGFSDISCVHIIWVYVCS